MIVAGGVTMALGHFSLAFHNAFFLGLFLIIVGNGCFKPNVSTQVGRLYGAGDGRRTTAFFIFYCGINLGAFLSPLVCGELRQEVGYDAGFAAAGFGMLLGLVIYLAGQKHLPPDREKEKSQATGKRMSFAEQVRENRPRVLAIVAVCVLAVPFWGVYEQQGNTIAVYGDKIVNRRIGGWEMPTEFLQSINPFLIFLLTPLLNALWAWQRKRNREPAPTTKMALGLFLLGLGYLLLALLTAEEGGHRLSILWIVVCMALYTTGELFLSPIGLTFVSAESPPSMTSLLMGCWFLSSFFGNYTAGWLGSFYPYLSHRGFFFMLTLIAGTAGVVMFVVGRLAVRMLPAR